MNQQNLKPIRSVSEAREKGRKGGKASGIARRAKRTLRDELNTLLRENIITRKGEKMNTQRAISVTLINAALQGDVKAYTTIRDIVEPKQVSRTDELLGKRIIFDLEWKEK